MGYKQLTFKLPTDYSDDLLHNTIARKLRTDNFSFSIEKKSLDARKKNDIHWQLRVTVLSAAIKGPKLEPPPSLLIPHRSKRGEAVIIGAGPAGFFAALVLQKSGYHVTLIERGAGADKRAAGINSFEKTARFNPTCNYAFGEGGAGTFSDGKLTSRSKHISREKQFILSCYVAAGAPEEIQYLAHPHLGSDNLLNMVRKLRTQFIEQGGTILFETTLTDLHINNGHVTGISTSAGTLPAEQVIIAPGHSAYDTYRMLMHCGVRFRTKNFAIGSRVEHSQALINQAQWGQQLLPGIKAAEYRLTFNRKGLLPVYTFCMCPGGTIVPATASAESNIVNGMSKYLRNGTFANAACVAGINLNLLLNKEVTAPEALNWVEALEHSFFIHNRDFKAPACSIRSFIEQKMSLRIPESSYPLGLQMAPLWEMLPTDIIPSMQAALKTFSQRLPGFENGNMLGLESKTSSPIQAIREKNGCCVGFDNLFIVGEGSGYSGGIISSAADGIKTAMTLIE